MDLFDPCLSLDQLFKAAAAVVDEMQNDHAVDDASSREEFSTRVITRLSCDRIRANWAAIHKQRTVVSYN